MIDKFIPPPMLLDLIWNTAPFLKDRLPQPQPPGRLHTLVHQPGGHLAVLAAAQRGWEPSLPEDERLLDYFALCLAAHHATVAPAAEASASAGCACSPLAAHTATPPEGQSTAVLPWPSRRWR